MTTPFRFQTLLDYRQRLVEDRQVELADSQRQLASAQGLLVHMQASRTRFAEQLQQLICGVLRINEIEHQYRYLAVLDQQIEAQAVVVAQAEEVVQAARARLEAALKERKTLEKLKEYDRQDFVSAIRQREAKQVDDFNIARYSHGEHR